MGATIKAPKDPKSCDCKGHHHPANAPDISDDSSLASSAPVEPQPLVLNGAFSDDLLVVIFGFLELPSLASAAASCASFARVCASEELWQHLVRTAFPLLPARLLPASPGGGGGGGGIAPTPTSPWRNLARLRSQTPHWRLQCNLMDEIESLLVASASTDASPFEGGQHGARLAGLAIAVFAHAEGSASASPPAASWWLRSELQSSAARLAARRLPCYLTHVLRRRRRRKKRRSRQPQADQRRRHRGQRGTGCSTG